jgi:glyoxylase-like metal-dependent hydrolase (beta-lactamase superfamily II)
VAGYDPPAMNPLQLTRRGVSVVEEMVLRGWPRYVRPLLHELIRRPPMREILPGIQHWTAIHPRIRQPVSSYYVEPAQLLIDPLVPREGIEWFERCPPQQIVLTNRHHYRQSGRFVEAFECLVRCSELGLHEFEVGRDVTGFAFGEELATGITAVEVGAICPDDTALHIAIGDGAIAFADALARPGGGAISFMPDFLLGDDPAAVKAGLLDSLERLLELSFDSLLFSHGEPLVGGGKRALREFVEDRRR